MSRGVESHAPGLTERTTAIATMSTRVLWDPEITRL